jgi:hypothetical protein
MLEPAVSATIVVPNVELADCVNLSEVELHRRVLIAAECDVAAVLHAAATRVDVLGQLAGTVLIRGPKPNLGAEILCTKEFVDLSTGGLNGDVWDRVASVRLHGA